MFLTLHPFIFMCVLNALHALLITIKMCLRMTFRSTTVVRRLLHINESKELKTRAF